MLSASEPPPDSHYQRACARQLSAWKLRAITDEELGATLYDIIVLAYVRAEDWDAALDSLPAVVRPRLLAYVTTHEPRVMNPRPSDPQRRAAQDREALVAQNKLAARLQQTSR